MHSHAYHATPKDSLASVGLGKGSVSRRLRPLSVKAPPSVKALPYPRQALLALQSEGAVGLNSLVYAPLLSQFHYVSIIIAVAIGQEGDIAAIGRPIESNIVDSRAVGQVSQVRTIGLHYVKIIIIIVAIRREGDIAAVRRPIGSNIADSRAVGQVSQVRTIGFRYVNIIGISD